MRRPTPQEIDDGILDIAAGVFAQFGYEQASVQRIADEAGYSKTGVLHRFASKEAIKAAVRRRCLEQVRELVDATDDAPLGPRRDRATVETLIDLAVSNPGTVALLLNAGIREPGPDEWGIPEARKTLDEAFGVGETTSIERRVQIIGCLGALGFGVLTLLREFPPHQVRDALVDTCCAALGH